MLADKIDGGFEKARDHLLPLARPVPFLERRQDPDDPEHAAGDIDNTCAGT